MKSIMIFFLILILPAAGMAADYTIPNSFQANTPALAEEVNSNFSAAKTAIDDNHQKITAAQTEIDDNTQRIAELETLVKDLQDSIIVLQAEPRPPEMFYSYFNFAQTFSDNLAHIFDISEASGASLSIDLQNSGNLAIFFNAECSVNSADSSTWLDIDILVDGVAAAPSVSDNAFCTSHGTAALDTWLSASTNVVAENIAKGVHTIEVRGTIRGFQAGESWRIDDIMLIAIGTRPNE